MLVAGLIVVGTLAPWVAKDLTGILRPFIERPDTMNVGDVDSLRRLIAQVVWRVAVLLAFPMFIFAAAAFASTIGQIGFAFSFAKLVPNLSSINPIAGFKQLFSMTSLVEAGKGLVKIFIIGAAVWMLIVPSRQSPRSDHRSGHPGHDHACRSIG